MLFLLLFTSKTQTTLMKYKMKRRDFPFGVKKDRKGRKKRKVISHLFIKHYIIQIFVRGSAGREVNLTEFFPINLLSS